MASDDDTLREILVSLDLGSSGPGRPTQGSIIERRNGDGSFTFSIRYQNDGRRRTRRIARVRPQHRELGYAQAAAELARRRALRWKSPILGDEQPVGVTWAQAADSFMEWLTLHRAAGTTKRYRAVLQNFSEWEGAPATLVETTHDHLEAYKLHRLEDVGRTPSGINFEITVLKRAWKWCRAKSRAWAEHDPFEDIEPLRDDSGEDEGHRVLTLDEVERFRACAPRHVVIAFDLALNTGLRRNELVFLDTDDIDPKRRVLHVRAKPAERHRVKTHERRMVPLNDDALDALARQKRRRQRMIARGVSIGSILFPAPGGHREGEGAGKRWRKIGDQIKYWMVKAEIADASMHDLRATFCTYLLAHTQGDLRYVQQAMGHKRVATTEGYLGFIPDAHHMAVRDFNAFRGTPQ